MRLSFYGHLSARSIRATATCYETTPAESRSRRDVDVDMDDLNELCSDRGSDTVISGSDF